MKKYNPEILIGKTIEFKPYDAVNYHTFKIESIVTNYLTESGQDNDFNVVMYKLSNNTVGDAHDRFPIRGEIIRALVEKGEYVNEFNDHEINYKLIYRIVNPKNQ